MQSREQVGGVALRRVIDMIAAGQIGHHQEIGGSIHHAGHGQVGVIGEIAQHRGFKIEPATATAKLGNQGFAVVKINPMNFGHTTAVE